MYIVKIRGAKIELWDYFNETFAVIKIEEISEEIEEADGILLGITVVVLFCRFGKNFDLTKSNNVYIYIYMFC